MCIMQIVWRTNGYIVNSIFFRAPAQFFQVAVESLDLGKELDIERILVEDAHRIFRVYRSHQPVARVSNRAQMTGRNVSTHTDHCKVFWHVCFLALQQSFAEE